MIVFKLVLLVILNANVRTVKIQKLILNIKLILNKKKIFVIVRILPAKKTIEIVLNQETNAQINVCV